MTREKIAKEVFALAVLAILPLGAADISPNPHQITRIVENDSAATISEFANNGELRKRGEGTLTLSAPALNNTGRFVVESGSAVLDLNAASATPALPNTPPVVNNLALWLDATQNVVTDGEGKVLDWFDCRETNPSSSAASHSHPFASSRHQWVAGVSDGAPSLVANVSALGGKSYVDFGPYGGYNDGGKWLCISNTSGSVWGLFPITAEAFVVFAKHTSGARGCGTFFGGHYNGTNCAPAWVGNTNYLWVSAAKTRADKGAVRLDRNAVWGGNLPIDDMEFHLVSVQLPFLPPVDMRWNLLGADRDYYAGGMRIAEVLTFSARLSDFDRMRVEEYLWRKWMGTRQTSVGTVAVNTGATVTIDTDSDVAGDLSGGGTVVKEGSGQLRVPGFDFSGTVELRGGEVRTEGAAFAVKETGQRFLAKATSVVSLDSAPIASGTVAKYGQGLMTIASLPADTKRLVVENGTLKIRPPAPRTVPVAATFPNGDFEQFTGVTDINNIGGGPGTTAAVSANNWTFDRTGRTANNAVTLVKNSFNTGTFKLQVSDSNGLGYDGAVSLLLCQGKATGNFTLSASGLYKASFRVAGHGANTVPFDAQILVDGVQVTEFTALSSLSFTRYEVALPFLAAGEHTFTISDVQPTQTYRIQFDDVKILPVEVRETAPVAVAIVNQSFEQPWTNLAGTYDDYNYVPSAANCTGWTFQSSENTWIGSMVRRRWYNGIAMIDNARICSIPDEMPDGFLCAQIYQEFSVSQSVTFPSAGRYRLRFHLARRDATAPQTVVVRVGDKVVRKAIVRHSEFRPYEATFDLEEGGEKSLAFSGTKMNEDSTPHSAGCALLDAVSLERVSETIPVNLVTNGTFEVNAEGWTPSGALNRIGLVTAGNWVNGIFRAPPQGADGIMLRSTFSGATLCQDVTFPAPGRYELSFRCQTFERYPTDLTRYSLFWVQVGDNVLHRRAFFDDGESERIIKLPFTVAEAGVKRLEFNVISYVNSPFVNVLIDDVAITAAAPVAARTDLANYIPKDMEVAVASDGVLHLDFDGAAHVAGVTYNGVKIVGEISHETCPDWVMGRGVLSVTPRGTMVIFR